MIYISCAVASFIIQCVEARLISNTAMLPSSPPVQQTHFPESSFAVSVIQRFTLVKPGDDLLFTLGQSDKSAVKYVPSRIGMSRRPPSEHPTRRILSAYIMDCTATPTDATLPFRIVPSISKYEATFCRKSSKQSQSSTC